MRDLIGIFAPLSTPEAAENVYRAMLWYYAPHPYLNDLDLNRDAFNEVTKEYKCLKLLDSRQTKTGNDRLRKTDIDPSSPI